MDVALSNWCRGPDSNRHGVLHRQILNLLRLPISPLRRWGESELWHSAAIVSALPTSEQTPHRPHAMSKTVSPHRKSPSRSVRKTYPTIEAAIGQTPLVALQRIQAEANRIRGNVVLGKLEGNNPAGSVKDRPALSMIQRAQERGEIQPGDTLIEATSGNTGIALAMAAAIKGYRMLLIMPEDLSIERAQTMKAFGAELILTPKSGGMEYARDLADKMAQEGKGRVLDQFANADNPRIHYETTGPELWAQTAGQITHFVSAMGTTGTITGVSRFLKEKNPAIRIIGAQPSEGSRIPGIRKWPQEYLPRIYDPSHVDELIYVSQAEAEEMCRRLAREEGIFAGISAAGACWVAQQVAARVENATIAFIVCDRGDRYLSTGVFPA